MARIDNLTNFLTDVATAIRNKKGTEEQIPAANFDTEIASITTSENLDDVLQEQTELITELEETLKTKTGTSIVPNIFMQETEPNIKEGIWIQSNKQVDNIEVVDKILSNDGEWETVLKNTIPTDIENNRAGACTVGDYIYIFRW